MNLESMDITSQNIMEVQVSGRGKTKEEAFSSALSSLQKKIREDLQGLPVRIEPLQIKVVKAEVLQYTERFLFLFMKRQREEFHLELEVQVRVFVAAVDNIRFQVTEDRRFFR